MTTGRIFSTAALAIGLAGAALAQSESNRVAAETDWAVFEGADPKECWAVTAPKETVNTRDGRVVSVRRGDILLFVTYRPEQKRGGRGQLYRRVSVCRGVDRNARYWWHNLRTVHRGRICLASNASRRSKDHDGHQARRRCLGYCALVNVEPKPKTRFPCWVRPP